MKIKVLENYYKSTEALLYNYNSFRLSILSMKEELDFMKDNHKDGVGAMSYDGIRTSKTYRISNILGDVAIDNALSEQELTRRIHSTQKKISRIDRAIKELTSLEKKIIEERYFRSQPWYCIAYDIKVSERHCKRLKSFALNKIAVSLYGDIAITKIEQIKE
jgi:hypothetical protein